ncbi:MAG: hypothetical protein KAS19_06330 [Anaerolineales bacterium]|nr:hypothetical protein [Anaerolineales bacterium]
MKIEILKEFSGHPHKVGTVVEVATDSDGVIIDRFWRRRVRDSKIDECVRVATKKSKPKTEPKSEPAEDSES